MLFANFRIVRLEISSTDLIMTPSGNTFKIVSIVWIKSLFDFNNTIISFNFNEISIQIIGYNVQVSPNEKYIWNEPSPYQIYTNIQNMKIVKYSIITKLFPIHKGKNS